MPETPDDAAAVFANLPWELPSARQVTEAAAKHGWRPDDPWLIPAVPAVPAVVKGRDHAAAEER